VSETIDTWENRAARPSIWRQHDPSALIDAVLGRASTGRSAGKVIEILGAAVYVIPDHVAGVSTVIAEREAPSHTSTPSSFFWWDARLEATSRREAKAARPGFLRAQRLSRIQAAFGFPMAELAAVLRVSRQMLYRWFDPTQDIRLQDLSRSRIDLMERIAVAWSMRSRASMRNLAHEPLAGGGTLLQLLSAADIDETIVVRALDVVVRAAAGKAKSPTQRLIDAGVRRRASTRALPDDE